MRFTSETITDGVSERPFTLGDVPGVLWSPAEAAAPMAGRPLVLLAHGRAGRPGRRLGPVDGQRHRHAARRRGTEDRRGRVRPGGARDPGRSGRQVTVPVEFLLQWDDELIPRESSLALFDAFASREESLHANPGRPADVPMFEVESSLRFFGRHLSPSGVPGGG